MSIYKELPIKSNINNYSVHFSNDFSLELITQNQDQFFIIDQNVSRLYANRLNIDFDRCFLVEALEENKTIKNIESIIRNLLTAGIKRNNLLVGVGGGIIQDITGFIASILFRGISWVFYPTTLLSQCDSCIGSKTSINIDSFKNQLGNFYPPRDIIVDLSFLETLTPQAIRSGFGEMIKVHLLGSPENWEFFKDVHCQTESLSDLIFSSLCIKKTVIEIDEFDKNYRNIMNYGHTFGHALESVSNYQVAHGEAVTVGMDISNYVSFEMGFLPYSDYLEIKELLNTYWPEYDPGTVNLDRFVMALSKDKKNVGNDITLILTRGPGRMFKFNCSMDALSPLLNKYFEDNTI